MSDPGKRDSGMAEVPTLSRVTRLDEGMGMGHSRGITVA